MDLETTGLDVTKDRVVEIGLVKLFPDGRRESIQRRVDPGIDIPESSTRIHGIRNDDVRGLFGEPALAKIAGELLAFVGDADLTGFNLSGYDLPLWLNEVKRHDLEFSMEGRHAVDARTIFVAREPGWDRFTQGPRNLNNAVLFYCGKSQADEFSMRDSEGESGMQQDIDSQNRHSAVKDAEATLDVLLAQLGRYDDLPRSLPELAAWCMQQEETAALR